MDAVKARMHCMNIDDEINKAFAMADLIMAAHNSPDLIEQDSIGYAAVVLMDSLGRIRKEGEACRRMIDAAPVDSGKKGE